MNRINILGKLVSHYWLYKVKYISGVAELHDTLKVEVEFLKKSSFCGFRVKKK